MSDNRTIIIGHVKKQPEIGKPMTIIETQLSISSKGAEVRVNTRTSSNVVEAEPIDGYRLWKVKTISGRTYYVEVAANT